MTKRVALVGVIHEAMLSCPFPTGAETTTVLRGEEIIAQRPFLVRGMIDRLAEEDGVEAVPLIFAKTWPGGGFERSFYDAFVAEAQQLLRDQGPFDAVALLNHGAMEVEGLDEHGDTHFARMMRAVTGDEIPYATAFDHHGQVTPELLGHVTVFTALREAPHRDDHDAAYRAGDLLLRCMAGEINPVRASVRVPVLMPGEWVMTDYEPAHGLFTGLAARARAEGVLNAEILVGFAWNDNPWTGMQAMILADGDPAAAEAAALRLAQDIWDAREGFGLQMETAELDEGLARAAASAERPVYVSDSGDNTSAGAGGDLTTVLQACIAQPDVTDAVVAGIYAPATVAQCLQAGQGADVTLTLGAEHRTLPVTDTVATGRVIACAATLDVPLGSGFSAGGIDWAVVDFDGVLATFHADRVGISSPQHLEAMGIHPTEHAIYVVKFGYLMPQLEEVAARHIVLLTEGCANLDLRQQAFSRVARPAFPLDPVGDSPEMVAFAAP